MKSFRIFAIIVILVAIAGLAIYFVAKSTSIEPEENKTAEETLDTSNAKDVGAIFFYSSTCPHCKVVEKYFTDNKVLAKIKVDKREVYGDKNNAAMMTEKQNLCKDLSENDKGGVPFLYTPDKCFVGSDTIIDFFNAEIAKLK